MKKLWDTQCNLCQVVEEVLIEDPASYSTPCMSCGEGVMKRVFTSFNVQNINLPQGGSKRFQDVKESKELEKTFNKIKDKSEKYKVAKEMVSLSRSKVTGGN